MFSNKKTYYATHVLQNNLAVDHLYRVQENDKAVFLWITEEITAKKGQVTLDQPLEFDMRPEITSFGSFSHPPSPQDPFVWADGFCNVQIFEFTATVRVITEW